MALSEAIGPIGNISPMKKTILLIAISLISVPLVAHAQDQRPPRLTTVTEERYRLQPGDVLEIQYRYSPEFNQTVTVQPDGYVTLEVGGDLKIAGMTVDQTRQAILKQASTRLQDPIATVILKEFQKPYFVVAGEVAQPGKIEMRERVTALQAIMLAGGMKESAKSSQVVVFRKINSDIAEVKLLNLKTIRRTSDLENDLTLQPGDMVFVLLLSWYAALSAQGLYVSHRLSSLRGELREIARAVAISSLALLVAAQLGKWPTINLLTVGGFGVAGFVLVAAGRVALRLNLRRLRAHGHNVKALVIIGA